MEAMPFSKVGKTIRASIWVFPTNPVIAESQNALSFTASASRTTGTVERRAHASAATTSSSLTKFDSMQNSKF
jgi:hypothetical protein